MKRGVLQRMQGKSGVRQGLDHGQEVPRVSEDGPEGWRERAECQRGVRSVRIG